MLDLGRVPIRSRWFQAWVAVAAAGLIVATALWSMPTGGASPASAPPASTAAGSPGPSVADPAVAAWEPYGLPPESPIADLVATHLDAAGVEVDTAFRLTSRTATSATDLAARLEVAPAIALRTAPGATASQAIVTPATALTPGLSYRFRIRADGGTVAASWLFRAKQPLHIVTSVPADAATDVPVRTGIEATFDQDGISGYEGKVSLTPAVPLRLELHGRTLAVVPQRELAERTLYTLTITHGIGKTGSDVTLEDDVVVRFETGGPATTGPTLEFDGTAADASPAEAPALRVWVCCLDGSPDVDQPVTVYRLPSLDAAISAERTLAHSPTWASWSDAGLVPTSGLAATVRFDATLIAAAPGSSEYVLRFPAKLAAGRYLVVMPRSGRDAQLVLQVTRLATFSEVSATRTLAWVNDVATGSPVPGATVSLAGGPSLGRTDADGLLLADTPGQLLPSEPASASADPVLVIAPPEGPAVFSLVSGDPAGRYTLDGSPAVSEGYWLAFATDRTTFRTTDTIQVWGTVRARDGEAPTSVELRVVPADTADDGSTTVVARATPALDQNGVFATSIPIVDLPLGGYRSQLVVDGSVVRDLWVSVDEVRKPAYRIDVAVDHHVLIDGETFRAIARAVFLDGTPVPGLELVFSQQGAGRHATTDADGRAALTLTATLSSSIQNEVWVRPARPEEGEVEGSVSLGIYPAAVWLTSDATLKGTSLDVSGRTQALDVAALERAWDMPESPSPGGDPMAGDRVTISVIRIVQHQEETGRRYDWISKQTVPEYRTWTTEEPVTSVVRTTDAGGRFALTVNVPDPASMYRVSTTARDRKGRVASSETVVDRLVQDWQSEPHLQAVVPDGAPCCDGYAVGGSVELEVGDAVAPTAAGKARFLFVAAQRGIRDAVVTTTGRLTRTFTAADVPNLSVSAIEFTGRGIVVAWGTDVRIDDATRRLKVVLATDATSYRPGADVDLTVRTYGPDGRPVAASVVLQAVDEKSYLMGQAWVTDPLYELYARVSGGILWSGATLRLRIGSAGDTTGGGGNVVPRTDFRDTLLFRRVSTDASGEASLTFHLSDDLTSWRVSAAAVDGALQAGSSSTLVPVGLPFFVEATIAPEFLASDRPVLRLRAYGAEVKAGDPVRFTVAAPSLGLAVMTVDGTAFAAARIALPPLTSGIHELRISGATVGRSPVLSDGLVRSIRVVDSRYQVTTASYRPLDAAYRPVGGTGLTSYVISDAGRGSLLSILERLAWSDGGRLDQVVGAAVARDLLVEEFDRDPAELPTSRFEAASYQKDTGLSLLPYGDGDLALTAQVALAAPELFDRAWLRERVRASYGDPESTMTRERGIIALAALAALGDPVAGELGPFAAGPGLTVRERLYLGLAYASLGDDAAARAIERSLLSEFGRVSGPWVRLEGSPDRDDVTEATGLLAVLAASLGDPVADRAQAYVEANPPRTTLPALGEIAFVRRSLERLPAEPVRFAWTVDGVRTVVALAAGESTTLRLTPAQRATLRLEPISGQAGVTTTSTLPATPGDRPADPAVTITRTVSPGTMIGETQIVRVRLSVTFADTASDGCYEVVDRVPSGLAPLAGVAEQGVIAPYASAGQLVRSCVARDMPSHTVGYSARVVSPGTFTWEPATVTASEAADRVSATGTTTLEIR
jgi:hypothetical protein